MSTISLNQLAWHDTCELKLSLPDDWEVAVGLDPTNADESEGQGGEGDFDGDGYSNYDEYTNQTNPLDSQDLPSVSNILQVLPHHNAGVDDNFRVANNSSFAVLISDRSGININSNTSVVFTVDTDAAQSAVTTPSAGDYIKDLSLIEGTASDSQGVGNVKVSIKTGANYFDWSAGAWNWTGTGIDWKVAQGTVSWQVDSSTIPFENNKTYVIISSATDRAGNPQTGHHQKCIV